MSDTNSDTEDDSNTITTKDELNLKEIGVPEVPRNIIFPNELNKYLRDQVQYLTHENGMLRKSLSENEVKLKQSLSKIETPYAADVKTGLLSSASNIASTKFVELSKKLREKTSELEAFKTKYSKLKLCIQEQQQKPEKIEIEETLKPTKELEDQIKTLQEKLNSTNTKLCESRNANLSLKNDLKLANKILVQELGDNFETLQSIISSNTAWRGRSQIICDLQQKNNELRDKLKAYQEKGTGIKESPSQTRNDKRTDQLTKENVELKNALQELKKKFDGSKARCKVLDSECATFKAKLNAITDQNEREHQLITTLTAQIANSQDNKNNCFKQQQNEIHRLEQQKKNLFLEISKEKCKVDNAYKILEEKDFELEELKNQLNNPMTYIKMNDKKDINRLEADRLRLLELNEITNHRLTSERTAHSNTQMLLRIERQKAAKLESKLARLQLEQNSDRSTYSNRSRESETCLKDRLELAEETIKALETRLQIEQHERQVDMQAFSKILQNYENGGNFSN